MDLLTALETLVEEVGRTWEQYSDDALAMDEEGAWDDAHFGPFQWQYHVPEPMRAVWSDLMEQARASLYWGAQKMAQAASDAAGDAFDRDQWD
jgi:hypothetical protein